MNARDLSHKFNSSDIFNTKNGSANGGYGLYDPHPFLKDQIHSDNRTRTSFQDSNIFTYKDDNNVTWQGTGRGEKAAGIKAGGYVLSAQTPGHTVYNPEASMAVHRTHTHNTFVEPDKDLYTHNDPKVPKSRLGEEIFGVKDFDRQAAKKELLSNDLSFLRHVDFRRDAAEGEAMTPEQRRQNDLYGSYHDTAQTFVPTLKDLTHETLANWRNPHTSVKRSNVQTEVNTFAKRAEELSSLNNPLTSTDYSEHTPSTKQQQLQEDVDKRVRDALYSDLYNQTGKYGEKTPITKRSEVHSMAGFLSKEGTDKGYRWGEDVSAAERRQDFNRTTGFPNSYEPQAAQKAYPKKDEINQARAQLRMPKVIKGWELESTALHSDEFYQKYNVIRDHREINVFSLRFSNLPKDMDTDTLKALSGAKHVVRAAIKTDNIKNECTGQGEITVRLTDAETKDEIVSRYIAAGLDAEDKPDDANQRKSNYKELATTGWRDSRLEFEEKRHVNTGYENQRISKIQNLTSNYGMGTNYAVANYGEQYADVVRNNQDGHYAAKKTALDEKQLLSTWDSMRPMTAQPARGGSSSGTFMKPTESFNTRSGLVQQSLKNRGYY